MALRSGLTLWAYTPPTATATQGLVSVPYQRNLMNLRFTTVNPGGYGEFSAEVYVPDARIPRPELGMFSRVAIMDGPYCCFLGEITEPHIGMTNGREYIRVVGLGLGNVLRDDPQVRNYTAQTPLQIASAELNFRLVTFKTWAQLIDPDLTGLFPDNPVATFSPNYDNRHTEEILADVCALASNGNNIYTWWTAAHALNRDKANFPTLQVFAHLEDFATTTYKASVRGDEVTEYDIAPSAERAYNLIAEAYNNGASGIAYAVATDTRLAADFSQNTAPFRCRRYDRDNSAVATITSSIATVLAAQTLAQYQNTTNKVKITLRAVRDNNGTALDLAHVNAFNSNILVPDMAVRGATLAVGAVAGTNQFHIKQTTYEETQDRAQVTIEADNYQDKVQYTLARLQLAADTRSRSIKSGASVQTPGMPIQGMCGVSFNATGAAQSGGASFTFPQQAANVPSSITLVTQQNNNATGVAVSQITALGAHLKANSVAAGIVDYVATYKTVGNTLLDVDVARGRFSWHCDGCDTVWRRLSIKRDLLVDRPLRGLTVHCAKCGGVEGYWTGFTSEHEAHENERYAACARHVRTLLRHEHVGLGTVEDVAHP